jgi:hypothetical protein
MMLLHHEQMILTISSGGGSLATALVFWLAVGAFWARALAARITDRLNRAGRQRHEDRRN